MGSEVMAEYAARIGETVRVLRCRGIEQDADGFLRLRAKDHHAGRNLAGLASVAVDVENAASAVAPGIHQNFISHSVRNEHAIAGGQRDRKSTRLNSSHSSISYAVFCLKKKKKKKYKNK